MALGRGRLTHEPDVRGGTITHVNRGPTASGYASITHVDVGTEQVPHLVSDLKVTMATLDV
jgi:hypothetical protein